MSYEVRDGVMYDHERERAKPVARAVADALDVLRAAGWTVEDTETWPGRGREMKSTMARSPWREVSE